MIKYDGTALVLGATGGIGGAITRTLLSRGWNVTALVRDAAKAERSWQAPTPRFVEGDAMKAEDVRRAVEGARFIVHAVNPPGYRDWDKLVLPMIDNTIAAATDVGARIVLPGTIYNFDPKRVAVIDEYSPQQPTSRKGAIRKEMEARLERASAETPVLILRAGDFFGADARQSWFTQAMAPAGKPLGRIINPAIGGAGHAWAYLPDLATAFARLMEMGHGLRRFERLQFEGYWDEDGRGMSDLIQRAAARKLPVWSFPWWAMGLAAPFGGFPREAWELREHWRNPMALDNRRLVHLIGEEPRTPVLEAVRDTLIGTGAMPAPGVAARTLLAA